MILRIKAAAAVLLLAFGVWRATAAQSFESLALAHLLIFAGAVGIVGLAESGGFDE